MANRGSFDQAIKPGGKVVKSSGKAYVTPNISKSKKKSFSKNYGKGSKATGAGKKGKAMGLKADHKPSDGGGVSMVGGMFGGGQQTGVGAPIPGRGPRKVSV